VAHLSAQARPEEAFGEGSWANELNSAQSVGCLTFFPFLFFLFFSILNSQTSKLNFLNSCCELQFTNIKQNSNVIIFLLLAIILLIYYFYYYFPLFDSFLFFHN
jgi:hypothetical protein